MILRIIFLTFVLYPYLVLQPGNYPWRLVDVEIFRRHRPLPVLIGRLAEVLASAAQADSVNGELRSQGEGLAVLALPPPTVLRQGVAGGVSAAPGIERKFILINDFI